MNLQDQQRAQMQNRAGFNDLAGQQAAMFNGCHFQGLGGLGASVRASVFGMSRDYIHKAEIDYEMQNDLDTYLKDWNQEVDHEKTS